MSGSSSKPVRNILVLGPTGNLGAEVIKAFQAYNRSTIEPFIIFGLTRSASLERTRSQLKGSLPSANVLHIDTYTNTAALSGLFRENNIQVLISTIATFSTNEQVAVVDAAIASETVQRFFPSEYGVDTSKRALVEKYLPVAALKLENVEHLRQASTQTSGRLSWTALIVGGWFDWSLKLPGVAGWDIPQMTNHVVDGGDVKFEATNIGQIAKGIVACLTSAERLQATKDKYVYINSFTTTQNEVIRLIESLTGRSMTKVEISAQVLQQHSKQEMDNMGGLEGYRAYTPSPEAPYAPGSVQSIWSCIYGGQATGGLCQYSLVGKGLWNESLGLPRESLEETVRAAVKELGMLAG